MQKRPCKERVIASHNWLCGSTRLFNLRNQYACMRSEEAHCNFSSSICLVISNWCWLSMCAYAQRLTGLSHRTQQRQCTWLCITTQANHWMPSLHDESSYFSCKVTQILSTFLRSGHNAKKSSERIVQIKCSQFAICVIWSSAAKTKIPAHNAVVWSKALLTSPGMHILACSMGDAEWTPCSIWFMYKVVGIDCSLRRFFRFLLLNWKSLRFWPDFCCCRLWGNQLLVLYVLQQTLEAVLLGSILTQTKWNSSFTQVFQSAVHVVSNTIDDNQIALCNIWQITVNLWGLCIVCCWNFHFNWNLDHCPMSFNRAFTVHWKGRCKSINCTWCTVAFWHVETKHFRWNCKNMRKCNHFQNRLNIWQRCCHVAELWNWLCKLIKFPASLTLYKCCTKPHQLAAWYQSRVDVPWFESWNGIQLRCQHVPSRAQAGQRRLQGDRTDLAWDWPDRFLLRHQKLCVTTFKRIAWWGNWRNCFTICLWNLWNCSHGAQWVSFEKNFNSFVTFAKKLLCSISMQRPTCPDNAS